jgi:hypothetical protein
MKLWISTVVEWFCFCFYDCCSLWSTEYLWNASFHFSLLILYTVGRTAWKGGSALLQGRYLHRINIDRHPCLEWDSKPRSQCLSGRVCFTTLIQLHYCWYGRAQGSALVLRWCPLRVSARIPAVMTELFRGIPRFVQKNAIRPRPLPCKSFPSPLSPLDSVFTAALSNAETRCTYSIA